MRIEIERKFLVKDIKKIKNIKKTLNIVQGYLCLDKNRTVRVRISNDKAFLTIKGLSSENGLSRYEFEKKITLKEAKELLKICKKPLIEKTRLNVEYEGYIFEIDKFFGENEGLVIAEIELKSEDENFKKPVWLGKEVTGDKRYYNSNLVQKPYKYFK